MNFKSIFLYFLGILYFNQLFLMKSSAELNSNSIIKIFCLESVKSQVIKAKNIYTESFGNEVCDCYLENINNNMGHENSIFKCKEDARKQLNSSIEE